MATSPHSNPEVAGSSLVCSQCPYGSGFTPRLRLAGWRSVRWDHLGGWEDRGISPRYIAITSHVNLCIISWLINKSNQNACL
ncbi:hypothetical protein Hanom_Chr07g00623281 [Helianthus anomalus]